ncbi:MAG: U32 family peptidase C-terminal domain-containing protein, partial [Neisseriaceae bacterium]|nr:U32 family peptidase C-terminal domain-containing protein [Neisseriaceae bacterium]
VDSLKIEGRTKSLYYVARTAQTYRRAIDDAMAGRPFNPELLADLEGLANRGYTSGFLERHRTQDYQNYLTGHSIAKRSRFVGRVLTVDENGWANVEVKNRFAIGDTLEIIHPDGNTLYTIQNIMHKNKAVEVAPGNGITVQLPNMQGKEKALLAVLLKEGEFIAS